MKKYVVLTQKGTLDVVDGEDYSSTYDMLKVNVEGRIECVSCISEFRNKGIDLWINEEGKLLDLLPTIVLTRDEKPIDILLGNVVFARVNEEGETTPLKDEDIEYIIQCLNEKVGFMRFDNPYTGNVVTNIVSSLEI